MDSMVENPMKKFYDIMNDPNIREKKLDFPVSLAIELTNKCNLNCLFCPTGTGSMKRERGLMSEDTFRRIIEDIMGRSIGINIARWGEPMLHPKLVEWIKMLKADGHIVHLNTNGILLNKNYIEQLLNSGLDSIKFSFQGIDKKSYEEMRQGANWEKYISSIKTMYNARGARPYMNAGTTTTYETNEQIELFINEMSKICDSVTIGKTKLEHIELEKTTVLKEEQKKLLSNLKHKQSLKKKHFVICPEIFGRLSIDWDGKVSGCCQDYDRYLIVGDIHRDTLYEIFNGEKIKKYREILARNAFDEIEFCSKCYDYMSIQS
jgi:radical SAM protein with 4Fe4S-binding SPASM domain